jgi:hypothetical protein
MTASTHCNEESSLLGCDSVDVVLSDVSEERVASIFRVEGKIRKSASEETVKTGASTRCHIPEDCFLHSHRRENLKSYTHCNVCHSSYILCYDTV